MLSSWWLHGALGKDIGESIPVINHEMTSSFKQVRKDKKRWGEIARLGQQQHSSFIMEESRLNSEWNVLVTENKVVVMSLFLKD